MSGQTGGCGVRGGVLRGIGVLLPDRGKARRCREQRHDGRDAQAAGRAHRCRAIKVGGGDRDQALTTGREVDNAHPPQGLLDSDTTQGERQPVEVMRRIDHPDHQMRRGCAFFRGSVLVWI